MASLTVEFVGDERKYLASLKKVEGNHEQSMAKMARATTKFTEADRQYLKQLREQEQAVRRANQIIAQHESAAEKAAREIAELGRLHDRGAMNAGDYRRALDRVNKELREGQTTRVDGLIGKTASLAAGWVGVQSAISLATGAIDDQNAKLALSLQKAKELAEAQAGTAPNIADMNPAVAREFLDAGKKIALKYGIADSGTIVSALGESYGVAGDKDVAIEAVDRATKLNALNPAAISSTAAASLDIRNAVLGKATIEESMGLLGSTVLKARVPDQKQLAEELAPTLAIATAVAPSANVQEEGRAAAAFFATSSQILTDTHGQISGQFSSDMIANTAKFFEGLGSMEAMKTELTTLEAEAAKKKLNKSTGEMKDSLTDKERQRMTTLRTYVAAGITDPGSFDARVDLLSDNPALQKDFLENQKFGGADRQVLTAQFLDRESSFRKSYEKNLEDIQFNAAAFKKSAELATSTTFEQRTTIASNLGNSRINASLEDPNMVAMAAAGQMADATLANTRRPMLGMFVDYAKETLQSGASRTLQDPSQFFAWKRYQLERRRDDVLASESGPSAQRKVREIDQTLGSMYEIDMDRRRENQRIQEEQLRLQREQIQATNQQTRAIEQQTELIRQQQPNQAPPANVLRAQAQAGAKQ